MTDLQQVKQKLQERMLELEARLTAINADVSHLNQPLSNDWSEQAVERENDEVLEALGNASQQEVALIKKALQRIDDGNYNTCQNCGQEIPIKRLSLVPHTLFCTPCAEEHE